jgi:hypothetical protein
LENPAADPSTFDQLIRRKFITSFGGRGGVTAGHERVAVGSSSSRCADRCCIPALGVDLYLHQQGIDTTTPAGKAVFQMMGVFAEFERAMIQERVRAGIRRAKAQGTKSGRPIGRPQTDAATQAAILAALRKGDVGIRRIAVQFGVGTGTVQRIAATVARIKS